MGQTVKFPAGQYYVGDLCYVIDMEDERDHWAVLHKIIFPCDDHRTWRTEGMPINYLGMDIYSGGTKYGDGVYEGSNGKNYSVDSGRIGIISVDHPAVDKSKLTDIEINGHASIETFDTEFEVSEDDGYFRFGDLEINTREDDEDSW